VNGNWGGARRLLTGARAVLLAASGCIGGMAIAASAAPAYADCAPAAGNDVTATCTGTTTNQGSGSPGTSAGVNGFGSGIETNLNTTVLLGATVTGNSAGIAYGSGAVINSGTISGAGANGFAVVATGDIAITNSGTIAANSSLSLAIFTQGSATVANSGSISGSFGGIDSYGAATVTNSGMIAGGLFYGIVSGADANVGNSATIMGWDGIRAGVVTLTNSGTLTGTHGYGVYALSTAVVTNSGTIAGAGSAGINVVSGALTLTNSGTISGGSNGIAANTSAVVTNSGTITGTSGNGIYAFNGSAQVTNSGLITSGNTGVSAASSVSLTNSGTVAGASGYGVYAAGDAATVINSGAITGGQQGVYAFKSASVTNSGTITGITGGIIANASANVTNSGTISTSGANSTAIYANTNAAVSNSGIIAATGLGGSAVSAGGDIAITNSGTIAASGSFGTAVFTTGSATVVNSGTIAGTFGGLDSYGVTTVNNTGTIAGGLFYGIVSGSSANVTNSGAITGWDGIRGAIVNLTNSGTITGTHSNGIFALSSAFVTNSGTIKGTGFAGIRAVGGAATVSNSGVVTGTNSGIVAGTSVSLTNSGTVMGTNGYGVYAFTSATVTNSGSIIGGSAGIYAQTSASVTNSGMISGASGIVALASGDVSNSGTIIGTSGIAIQLNASGVAASDTLTVLPGARFGGKVDFGGGADKVTFGPGSWILNTANFDATLSTVATAGNPYVVTPNQIIVGELSGFGAQNRAIMDITGWISSVLPDVPVFVPGAGAGGRNSFAALDSEASPFDAFTNFPPDALGYAEAPAFKASSATYADGSTVWAKGFGGQRQQATNGAFIGAATTGYGGAVGYERLVGPDLKIAVLIGGSTNRTNLYQSAGNSGTDTMFGGAYGRKTWGANFLDLAVIGGSLDNTTVRNIGGGLALLSASATYGGWFISPSLVAGRRIDIDGRGFTVTPALKVRYVDVHFDGYAETGAGAADLTVADRDLRALEERAEVTFANSSTTANGNLATVRVTGGVLGQQRTAGGQVNVALLGLNFLAATPDPAKVTGAYGAVGLDWRMGRVTLFAAGEYSYTNDTARSYAGKGGVHVGW